MVGEARDGEEALRVVAETEPDVVLLDVRMPRLDGIGVLRALQARESAPPCLVLTTFDDGELILQAIREGAKGYLRKDVSLEQLVAAIETLVAGGTLFEPTVEKLLRGFARTSGPPASPPASPPPVERLTAREIEVLRLMACGYSNREIAGALGTAEGTVKVHVSNVLGKVGVRDRTRAVLKALEWGLL